MRGKAERIYSQRSDIDVQPGRRLHGVGVKCDAVPCIVRELFQDSRDICDWLHCADFIVRQHDTRKNRPRAERTREFGDADPPTGIATERRHLESEFFQLLGHVESRMVFDCGRDDMVPCTGTMHRISNPECGGVNALGAATREQDFGRPRAKAIRHRLPRRIDCRLRIAANRVKPARVAEAPIEERQHRIPRLGSKGRGGGVVEVNHRSIVD